MVFFARTLTTDRTRRKTGREEKQSQRAYLSYAIPGIIRPIVVVVVVVVVAPTGTTVPGIAAVAAAVSPIASSVVLQSRVSIFLHGATCDAGYRGAVNKQPAVGRAVRHTCLRSARISSRLRSRIRSMLGNLVGRVKIENGRRSK